MSGGKAYMIRNSSQANILLDVNFYKNLYKVEGSENDIRTHYNTTGVSKSLIPNMDSYVAVLAQLTHFNLEVFISNVNNPANNSLIKAMAGSNNLTAMMKKFYSDLTNPECENGELFKLDKYRFINSYELLNYNIKWDRLMRNIYNYFNFDINFYAFFYKAKYEDDLFMDWLKYGIYKGYHPNRKSYIRKTNMLHKLNTYLHKKKIDINYIIKPLTPVVSGVLSRGGVTLGDIERPLFIFFNYARLNQSFWNAQEKEKYIENHKNVFSKYITYLHSMKSASEKKLNKKYRSMVRLTNKKMKKVRELNYKQKMFPIENVDKNMKLLKKITSRKYVSMFKRINNLEEKPNEFIFDELITIILKNKISVDEPNDYSNIPVKTFILNFYYNSFLEKKEELESSEYITFVKKLSCKLLRRLSQENKIQFIERTVMKDLDYIIANKKMTKYSKFKTRLFMCMCV
jgi:hypothetical protein